MSEIESDRKKEKGRGNTKTRPITEGEEENRENRKKKQEPQSKYWCFTFNNYDEKDIGILENLLKPDCVWYLFQEEIGEMGTPHLQGTLYLKKPNRLTALKRINPVIHWEMTRSVKASVEYCSKYQTRTGKIYAHGIDIPEQVEVDEPYGWQLKVMEIISEKPDNRTINWFYEETGGKGKSTLCKYLIVKHNALVVSGKTNDIFHAIAQNPSRRKIIIIDLPRVSESFINYSAIEQVKNGFFLSGKYEGGQIVYPCPHVIIFANHKPDMKAMSRDRWRIYNIDCEIHNYKVDNNLI